MKRRNAVMAIALVAVLSTALPAVGASPDQLVRKALKLSKKADKRSKQALDLAKQVSAKPGTPGTQGPQGAEGQQGPPGPFPDALPSGKTLRGVYTVGGMSEDGTTGDVLSGAISFPFPLASAPTGQVVNGGPAPPDCPGTDDDPQAAPGMLCVYVGSSNAANLPTLQDPTTAASAPSRFGVTLNVTSTPTAIAGVTIRSRGTWAVTAP